MMAEVPIKCGTLVLIVVVEVLLPWVEMAQLSALWVHHANIKNDE